MLLWVSLAFVSAVVLTALLAPLLRALPPPAESNVAENAVYKDQVDEIDADLGRGLIGAAEADAAKRELARRFLARAELPTAASKVKAGTGTRTTNRALIAAIALVPAVALLLYQSLGSPHLSGQPFLTRISAPAERNSVDQLIARVEARLRDHPEDGPGWDLIAPVYAHQERFADAAEAYGNAIRLLGPSVNRLAGFAESTVIAGNGVVSEKARLAYEQVLKLDPKNAEARFWLAMAKEQDGKTEDAKADYRALLAGAPPDAPWRKAVEGRLAGLEQGGSAPADDRGRGAAPNAEAAANLQQLSPDDRMRAISAMVDGLAARLKKDGNDLNGWLRLVRAYKVLGRDAAAVAALADARKAMQGNDAALTEIDALAKGLGFGS